jgi:GDP-L-fucose synthase
MNNDAKIYVAGDRGLVGSAIVRNLKSQGYTNLLTRTRAELDLRSQADVDAFFALEKPEFVFLGAAKVGGILANSTFPADFIYDNLAVQTNVIHSAWKHGVRKLLFLGSSCIYPKFAGQPMREEYLLTGELEPTNEWYAIAKIAGIKMAQAYRKQYGFPAICIMPTNLYGPGDNFDPQSSHVLPALLRKFREAMESGQRTVTIWGSGSPRREFLHVDDMAAASVFLMQTYDSSEIINVGTGEDVTIAELAHIIAEISGFHGDLVFDSSKPDGTLRKLLDVSRLHALGWKAKTGLREGIAQTYNWYVQQFTTARV